MKIRYIGPQKSILVLAVGIFMCWTVAGNSSEPWDAKASARVNLRRNPSIDGVILRIVPKGHKVRILEKKGLWCKVDVEGDIHGKGWVYAEYLEEILPKAPATEPVSQTVRVEIAAGEPKQGIHPAEPFPKAGTEGEAVKPLRSPLPVKPSITGKNGRFSTRNERRETKNDSIALLQVDPFMAPEPPHAPPAQPAYADLKQDALGISEKSTSAILEQKNASFRQKNLYDGKKKQDEAISEIPSPVREKAVTDARAVAASIERPVVSHETKELINGRESMGPVEIILKLSAIALSGLVILFLHRANKIATNHYDALIKFQHSPDSRQLR